MNGALTSKAMWELSRDYSIASSVMRGYRASGLNVDYKLVQKTILQAAKQKQLQMLSQIETYSEPSNDYGTITLKYGWGKFIDSHTVEIISKTKLRGFWGKTLSLPQDRAHAPCLT